MEIKKVVLYNNDFEPISVIELQPRDIDLLNNGEMLCMAVRSAKTDVFEIHHNDQIQPVEIPLCRIRAEKVLVHGKVEFILFTNDETEALLLKSVFVSGQQSALNDHKKKAFWDGMLAVLAWLR